MENPARFWWLKRLAALAVMLLAAMFGSYWAVGAWADRRIEHELAEWRKLPVIQPEDTLGTAADLADPKNPAFHVAAAMAGRPRYTTEQMEWDNTEHRWPPLTENDVAVIRSFEAGLRTRLASLGKAREAAWEQEYQWALGPISVGTLLPHLNPMRQLCNEIGWAMLLAHHDGDIALAMQRARDNRTLSEATLSYGSFLVCSLVAVGIESVTHQRLLELAGHEPPHRTLEEELSLWRQHRAEVRTLIDELLAPEYYRRLAEEGTRGEWTAALSMRDPAPAWGTGAPPRNPATAAMLDVNTLGILEVYAQYRALLVEADSYNERVRLLSAIEKPAKPASIAAVAARSMFYQFVDYDMERPVRTYARVETTAYVAAVALASRLFEADHDRLPASLEELVPDYLPRIPEDPFDPAGAPLRYVVIEGLPVVYSVGEDGTDDAGSVLNLEPYSKQLWKSLRPTMANLGDDYVYPLRYPARLGYDPLKWLQERQASQEAPAASQPPGGPRPRGPSESGAE